MTKEIEDINGRPVKAGHIIRVYSDYYIVGVIDNELWAEKFGSRQTIMMANWDDHFEIIGQTIYSLLTQPADVQERAKELELFKRLWYNRNPVHENNADSGEDMFWGTAELVAREYAQHLAGASSLQAENERLRENYQSLSGKYDYLLEENERLNSVLKALNKQ